MHSFSAFVELLMTAYLMSFGGFLSISLIRLQCLKDVRILRIVLSTFKSLNSFKSFIVQKNSPKIKSKTRK
jgi:hypothetical protein